jgi:autotransporter-associated beta strand protein
VNFGTGGWLSVGQNNGTSAFDGPMTGVGYAPGYTLGKTGAGTFTLNGNATFSAGITHVYAGKLIVNGSLASAVTVDSTAALGGGGTVGALTANGTISPGASPGRLSCGNVTFGASSSLAIELNGNTVGSGYDQLNVGGSVNLTGAALPPLTVGFLPAEGDQFIIVNNDGSDAITNTFDGLAEGAVVSDGTGKFNFRVSYLGGSGNDVVLTMTNRALEAGDAVVWSGNGNGAVETNECNLLNLELRNITLSPVSGLQATLRSLSPGVAVVQPYSRYPNIPVLSTRTNESFFQLTTLPGFTCGAKVDLELQVATTSHGNLKVPFSLPSGVAGSAVRFNNNVTTAIPDGGFVDKTFAVSGITTPLKKVVVSLHITHTADSDLDIWLIGPDGTTVNLSSDNGGTGDDYGTDCADAFRTTFDSSAATSITAGSAPFAGLFRPEQSLAAFNEKSGAEANGTWTLRIADDTAGAVGSIRCCSLILHPTDCSPGSGICELCPDVTIKSYTGPTTPQQSQYFQANGVVSSCGAVKACPPAAAGVFPAESFTFQNGPADACITVDASNQSPSGSLVAAAYLGSFNPAGSLCVNYLGDAGYYINASHPSQSFSFNVPANAVFILNVVTDAGGIPYTLAVSGGNCRPLLNITRTGASNLELDWTTAAPAYRLEGASPLVGGAWTEIPPVPPVVVEGKFKVTETMSPTNYFYRLHKP